ncbi:TPA: hypothetical protein N5L62_001230 [Enterobacter hormaechei subsp. steigerwaltii]|nr:hypothetical protein [Enterobacter hormaechei subsp. steigerwaltii]HCM9599695.1 hypothetical protein [Enterobacter hormaechei subsp. steigerwaltii]HCM9603016.1 hypothetical protein [Enterobacter hormaechei subsp. steigerwaltii]
MRESINVLFVVLSFVALIMLIRFFVRRIRHPTRIVADSRGMKKISTHPVWFGGSSGKTYFYDEQYLYEVIKSSTRKIELATIIKIKPSSIVINNRRIWSVTYLEGTREKQVQFYNNLTVFNQNFAAFLEAVKRVNPEADIKAVSLFNL